MMNCPCFLMLRILTPPIAKPTSCRRLDQNYLTGPLSASIRNLTRMQWLSLGINALSGEVPSEIGLLTDLRLFAIGTNNFSGPLPPELGNCSLLQQLYFDSSGVSGEIPSTFANLQNLETVWASDTQLTGRIPNFIGNWSRLTGLRFQGNSFEGSIPSTFANLTSLTELRISGLSNESSLAFIRDMKSLSILDLRNNNISGTIPSNIGEYESLTQLFLGNNNLNGTLPVEKSSSLRNIDVSYNNIAGSFPSWISQQNLSINLVANNFTMGQSNSSGLPSGLNCLQRNFPCNRGPGIYFNFGINSGGPQITSSDGTLFERDDLTIGPASYYVTDTNRWAVSNVGYFAGSNNPQYTVNSASQFTNTLDTELFQTARISASSLRYYGLGLENGNYTVRLQFAEIQILDTNRWESLGRRVFDIYIQGSRVLEDFDIKREAGNVSRRAVIRQFTAVVSENYLEIHLFWAGKGTCCVPAQGTYGPLISAISATPDFIPTVSNNAPTSEESRTGLIVGISIGAGVVCLLLVAAFFYFTRRRPHMKDDEELLGIDARPYTFSYAELKAATEDFSPANKLGEGGFGPVYKGRLDDGRAIAVKQLSAVSRQGKSQFVTEIATISAVQHRNLVKLYGCCIEAEQRLLVYEYLENKSLDQILFEIVSGRPNSDSGLEEDQMYLLEWAWHVHEQDREVELVDSSLSEFDEEEVKRVIGIALMCTQTSPMQRPSMSRAVAMLLGDTEVSRVVSKPGYLTEWRFDDDDGSSFLSNEASRASETSHVRALNSIFQEWRISARRGQWNTTGDPCSGAALDSDSDSTDIDNPDYNPFIKFKLPWALITSRVLCHLSLATVQCCNKPTTAWQLHEEDRDIELADVHADAEAVHVPCCGLVAMLLGDTEVSRVVSKPIYLSYWRFDDTTSFMSNEATRVRASETSYYDCTSMVAAAETSPVNVTKPMLRSMGR
ncbi:hypothetical protein V6N11_038889 [Hibiscus sabdariffa]|uniref:non-specific serine/threonine protein kinase n=1 Tax=Hibiscus sabdariffa TaxID=183260 RepID=A0ABR2SLA7_9ROSI